MLMPNLWEKYNVKIGSAYNASSSASFFGILIAACGKESDLLLGQYWYVLESFLIIFLNNIIDCILASQIVIR